MPDMSKCLLIVAITALSGVASADETQEFVKITCVASAEQFGLEYVTLDYHEAFGELLLQLAGRASVDKRG